MNKDEKIRVAFQSLQESVKETRAYIDGHPDEPMSSIELRGWIFATQIHLENLEVLLHDLQPTLF